MRISDGVQTCALPIFAGQRQRPVRNARSGRVALLVPARGILSDDGTRLARFELLRPLKRSHITEDQLSESSWEDITIDAFRDAWAAEVEEARTSHKRERLYLAMGLQIGRASCRERVCQYV